MQKQKLRSRPGGQSPAAILKTVRAFGVLPQHSMRTPAEIKERIQELSQGTADFFGVQRSDLVTFLPFKEAQIYLKEGVTEEEWDWKEPTEENIKKEILDYMPFAWDKANDMRGLSANRSIDHMMGWLWLISDELYQKIAYIPYEHYGKEKLVAICEHFGWQYQNWDDGVRTNG